MPIVEDKKTGLAVSFKDFTQRNLEDFYRILRREKYQEGDGDESLPEYTGKVVRALAELGLFEGSVEIDSLSPGFYLMITRAVSKHINEALTINPE